MTELRTVASPQVNIAHTRDGDADGWPVVLLLAQDESDAGDVLTIGDSSNDI